MERLQQALTVGRKFKPLTDVERALLLNKTAQAAKDGAFELYKTSHHFDATYQHPEYLGQS